MTLHKKPVQLDCSFIVNATDTGGLGITNFKGAGIQNVYMHTSATPAAGNPNPQVGLIYVKFQDNYNFYYLSNYELISANTGSTINISTGSSLTIGNAYVIKTLGTTTTANWVAVGVPIGITPAVGLAFIAIATSGSGTGTVGLPAQSTITKIETVGNPGLSITSQGPAILGTQSTGAYGLYGCYAATNSTSTVLILTAPGAGTMINMKFLLSNSSITVQGD